MIDFCEMQTSNGDDAKASEPLLNTNTNAVAGTPRQDVAPSYAANHVAAPLVNSSDVIVKPSDANGNQIASQPKQSTNSRELSGPPLMHPSNPSSDPLGASTKPNPVDACSVVSDGKHPAVKSASQAYSKSSAILITWSYNHSVLRTASEMTTPKGTQMTVSPPAVAASADADHSAADTAAIAQTAEAPVHSSPAAASPTTETPAVAESTVTHNLQPLSAAVISSTLEPETEPMPRGHSSDAMQSDRVEDASAAVKPEVTVVVAAANEENATEDGADDDAEEAVPAGAVNSQSKTAAAGKKKRNRRKGRK